mmetsp:Transcript_18315/g.62216  ORF Transcript_18315/g.62216 Transcript_18315/m.62216 type:complete len:87 (+) Transcript_18315:278-538(+)
MQRATETGQETRNIVKFLSFPANFTYVISADASAEMTCLFLTTTLLGYNRRREYATSNSVYGRTFYWLSVRQTVSQKFTSTRFLCL